MLRSAASDRLMNVPKWLRWIRFIPVKLHLVMPIIFALLGAYIGYRDIADFWNIYVAGSFFLGIPVGIYLQVLKTAAHEAAGRANEPTKP